jgi:hypothetical protein
VAVLLALRLKEIPLRTGKLPPAMSEGAELGSSVGMQVPDNVIPAQEQPATRDAATPTPPPATRPATASR